MSLLRLTTLHKPTVKRNYIRVPLCVERPGVDRKRSTIVVGFPLQGGTWQNAYSEAFPDPNIMKALLPLPKYGRRPNNSAITVPVVISPYEEVTFMLWPEPYEYQDELTGHTTRPEMTLPETIHDDFAGIAQRTTDTIELKGLFKRAFACYMRTGEIRPRLGLAVEGRGQKPAPLIATGYGFDQLLFCFTNLDTTLPIEIKDGTVSVTDVDLRLPKVVEFVEGGKVYIHRMLTKYYSSICLPVANRMLLSRHECELPLGQVHIPDQASEILDLVVRASDTNSGNDDAVTLHLPEMTHNRVPADNRFPLFRMSPPRPPVVKVPPQRGGIYKQNPPRRQHRARLTGRAYAAAGEGAASDTKVVTPVVKEEPLDESKQDTSDVVHAVPQEDNAPSTSKEPAPEEKEGEDEPPPLTSTAYRCVATGDNNNSFVLLEMPLGVNDADVMHGDDINMRYPPPN